MTLPPLSVRRRRRPAVREELRTALVFFVFAGMDTTRHQLGLAIQTFLDHPDQWRLLGQRPDLGRAAVEEVMRVNPTITWITVRPWSTSPSTPVDIAAGTTLQLFSQAAGTDPLRHARPSFDITVQRPLHTASAAVFTTASATWSLVRT